MKFNSLAIALLIATAGCKAPAFIQGGQKDGVTVSYRWNHPQGKPSELLLKMTNSGTSPRQVHVGLDLYYQALTVEQFAADTCIPAGRTFNGKLNGFYFIPQHLTREQLQEPDSRVELTEFTVAPVTNCP